MAVSAVVAAVSTGVGVATGTIVATSFSIFGATLIGAAATSFLVSTAMGAALNALSPKPPAASATRGYSLAGESGAALDHQIIYGETKVGGVRVYDTTSGGDKNKYLHRILVFAGHEIDSYTQIYVNDDLVTLDGSGFVISPSQYLKGGEPFIRIKRYLGTSTQTADSDLSAEVNQWTASHKLSGLAYIYVRFEYDADVFPNGVPTISAVIKGKKVYDPRTATTVWSDNPALCLRDYLTQDYGLGIPSGRVSDDHVIAAANICDQSVTTNLGTTARYTCNGAFVTAFTPSQVISDIITSMGGLFWYSQGKWRMKASAYTTPTVTLNEDDLRSSVSVSTRHSRRDTFNTVKGKFKGYESDWQEADYPQVISQPAIDADNGLVNTADYSLPFTTSSVIAQRIAKVFLFRNREQLTVTASFGLKAFQVEVGDIVNLSLTRFGWTPKTFEVTNWSFGLTEGLDLQVSLTLREISSDVFEDVDGTIFENNNTTLPSAFTTASVGVAVSSATTLGAESLINTLYATITALDESSVERVEVQYKLDSDTVWNAMGVGDLGTYQVSGLPEGMYDVQARSYSYLGVKSGWTNVSNFQLVTQATPPNAVTSLSYNLSSGSVNLQWLPISNADLSFYRIRHSVLETGATWSDATTAASKVPRPATSTTLPVKSGTYMIRPYNKSDQTAENFSSVVIPSTILDVFANNPTVTDSPTFSGTKSNTSVTSSNLRLTTYTGSSSTGTYDFSTYIDTTAVRRVRARVDLQVSRYSAAGGLFDDLIGLFDSQSGLFDNLTGFAAFDDTDVITYISFTNDDPAGSPSWSPYQPFVSGDFYGRAFRFRVELTSSSPDVTPSISSLIARVQYN